MPLIDCPECGREVSRSAAACPNCGYPIGSGTSTEREPAARKKSKSQWWKLALSLLGRVGLGAMLAGIGGGEEESVAAVMGGLIIAGSAIPTWYRWKIDQLKSGSGSAALAERLEERIAELGQQQREQLSHLEQVHAGQIAELEERIDFAERLLTKRGEIGPS